MKVKVLQAATNKCNKTCRSAPAFLGNDNEFLDSPASLEPIQVVLSAKVSNYRQWKPSKPGHSGQTYHAVLWGLQNLLNC